MLKIIYKGISLMLSLVILLSCMTLGASAETTYAASVGNTQYTTVAEAVANANGQPVKLLADSQETVTANGDLYLDLNGYTLAGLTVTGGILYGMDSTTDDYDCSDGYGKILRLTGSYAPHHKTDITGPIRRYLAVEGNDGAVSFHRFYVGLTYASMRPTAKGVGYKAVFAGDSQVKGKLNTTEAFGYTLSLDGHEPVSVWKKASEFAPLKTVTLLLSDFDAENYGETDLSATVQIKLADNTVISAAAYTTTLKTVMEAVNDTYTEYTEKQIGLLADWIKATPNMLQWRVENIVPRGPTIQVSSVTGKAGDTVEVPVVISGNPGIAGAKITISYSGLTLTGAASGDAFSYLQYTKPGKFVSPCNFTWDSENGEATDNGTILTLTFQVPADAKAGASYEIGCSYRMGDIYDEDLNDLEITVLGGKITIPAGGITVTFADHDGTVLKTQEVQPGEAATAPADPTRDGYIFTGWDKDFSNVTESIVVTAQYQQLSGATIMVSNVTASAGETVEVPVVIVNNPGVAGAKITVSYNGLTLTGAASGDAFSYLQYTKPGKFVSPCNFTWDSESGEATENGTILTLTFQVPADAKAGDSYEIGCSYRMGDMYDEDLNDLEFVILGGTVTVA